MNAIFLNVKETGKHRSSVMEQQLEFSGLFSSEAGKKGYLERAF